ncbi:CidA/LrgA family protein [Tuberibacillus sp. Marseille-P3662]|uniref:CidA/LrgA family protein n=1 Tax=Tuberibacillus sp. Marseille-P3662 TaxID=1965358 RepID=UPI000A1CBB4A|nr:CidA/LrgA family holin-like protein [Tuberibacillus sp. Marseille-P3662]
MKILKIVAQIAVLYMFYFIGEGLQHLLHLPIPGSIIGLFLLLTALIFKLCPVRWIESGADFLLSYLPLLFVPATVGVMNYFGLFAGKGIVLLLIVVISTIIVMIVAGHTSQILAKKVAKRKEKRTWQKRSWRSS